MNQSRSTSHPVAAPARPRTATVCAELLRRQPDSFWPEQPEKTTEGDLTLESLQFRAPLAEVYRTTCLARA